MKFEKQTKDLRRQWDTLKLAVGTHTPPPKNLREFADAVLEWDNIPQQTIQMSCLEECWR